MSVDTTKLRVAIVHYWLVGMRGGERVVESLCELYPQADIFTHVVVPERLGESFRGHTIRTTFIQRLPRASRWYQRYLPLMPLALEQLDLRGYDLVISSESGPAKGVVPPADALHLCYCHSPMRYLWNMYHDYREHAGALTRWTMPALAHYLRLWDTTSASRVDRFVANSDNVRRRIHKYYRRDADVLHPPVDVGAFSPGGEDRGYYLVFGQLTRYKRVDVAVEAFNRTGRRLVVAGGGEELASIRALAGANVTVRGPVTDAEVASLYAGCTALVFPGEEDFGMVPVEAMACGKPVIALGRGGAVETVVDGESGLFFDEQTPEALADAVDRFESMRASLDPSRIAAHARRFDKAAFATGFEAIVAREFERASGRGGIETG